MCDSALASIGLEFDEDDCKEVKRPKRLPLFDMSMGGAGLDKVPIVTLSCGSLHCAAIAASGAVYTFGCNDEGALGRPGKEDQPLPVNLPIRCTGVATGDSHSIFYSTVENKALFCGLYRVSFRWVTSHISLEFTRSVLSPSQGTATFRQRHLGKAQDQEDGLRCEPLLGVDAGQHDLLLGQL